MLLFARSFTTGRICCASEHEAVVEHFSQLLQELGVAPETIIRSKSAREHSALINQREVIERVFVDFGYSGEEPSLRILRGNLSCERCAAACIAG
ncbi:MAG: hypothetical protein Q4B42_04440, partial [Oscillospiraceae bacterium]|nr:hypothetical protein [Oscillospiraceae bacterium]